MTREELDFIGSMNMFDEISNEAYKKIVCHCEEQEPCEDAISRSAVYECFDCTNTKAEAINALESLPFIIPKEPIGHWLRKPKVVDAYDIAGIKTWGVEYLCNLCEFTTTFIQDHGHYHYCPNCGAKMVEPKESEDKEVEE